MFGTKLKQLLHTSRHSLFTVISILFGFGLGLLLRHHVWPDGESLDQQTIRYFQLPGMLYLRTFRLLLGPLLITSLTTSFFVDKTDAQGDHHHHHQDSARQQFDLQKVTGLTFLFFIVSSTITITMGITTVSLLRPGSTTDTDSDLPSAQLLNQSDQDQQQLRLKQESFRKSSYQFDSLYNILLSIFPDNPLTPFFMKSYEQTEFLWPTTNLNEILAENYKPKHKIQTSQSFSPNMLGICVLSLSLGFILSKLPAQKTETIRNLLLEIDLVVKFTLSILIRIMPFGMFCWMFTESLKMKSVNTMFSQLFRFYSIAFVLFLFIWFIFYPVTFWLITRDNPFRIHRDCFPAYIVAFAGASSALALPVTMECMEQKQQLSRIISKMVLPLGMTINMNGAAMWYPMVAVFVSQVKQQVPQSFITLIILGLFALVMSMGFPGVPSGSAFLYHLAFASVLGVDDPQDIIVVVLTFDWIFDRIRTTTNIMGDCFVAKCVEKLATINMATPTATPTLPDESVALNNFQK